MSWTTLEPFVELRSAAEVKNLAATSNLCYFTPSLFIFGRAKTIYLSCFKPALESCFDPSKQQIAVRQTD